MNSDQRMQLQISRTIGYGDIMRTTLFCLVAIAAIIGFGATGLDIPLGALTIAVALFGILAGGTALDDISALRSDMDEATAGSTYGVLVRARNLAMLKALSSLMIAIVGIALLAAIFMT